MEKVRVSYDRNYYKVFITLSEPVSFKLVKDPKHDLLALKMPLKGTYEAEYYSVLLKVGSGVLTLKVKNPKLDLARAWVSKKGRTLVVFIPFKKEGGKYVVVIDPGHGGHDAGAVYYGVKEKTINLQIAKKLAAYLKKDGRFVVYLTRSGDYFVPLGERQKFTSKVGADLFISLHANANPYKRWKRGVEFYVLSDRGVYKKFVDLAADPKEAAHFLSWSIVKDKTLRKGVLKNTLAITQEEGEDLAEALQKVWCKRLKKLLPCRGIFHRNFAVLKVPGVPTVLVEVGYMTNYTDLRTITNSYYQWLIARALYFGILDYLHLSPPKR
ncbi:MAG: N-acetylmuramoyl-L-alanine amidase [Aquificae bacterium]|nr:N-acetylmuramoyl-L-alanine amidase [Aquificota bacterium]